MTTPGMVSRADECRERSAALRQLLRDAMTNVSRSDEVDAMGDLVFDIANMALTMVDRSDPNTWHLPIRWLAEQVVFGAVDTVPRPPENNMDEFESDVSNEE